MTERANRGFLLTLTKGCSRYGARGETAQERRKGTYFMIRM